MIATRWPGVSPREVLEEWPAELVLDALQVMGAEAQYEKRERMKREADAKREAMRRGR